MLKKTVRENTHEDVPHDHKDSLLLFLALLLLLLYMITL